MANFFCHDFQEAIKYLKKKLKHWINHSIKFHMESPKT